MLSDKILYVFKWIAGVIGGVTAIAGVITIIYTQGVRSAESKYRSDSIELKVDKLIVLDSVKNIKLDQVLGNQEDFTRKQVTIEKKLDDLNRSYVNHLKTDKRVDELIEYLQDARELSEVKKKGTSYVTQPSEAENMTVLNLRLRSGSYEHD